MYAEIHFPSPTDPSKENHHVLSSTLGHPSGSITSSSEHSWAGSHTHIWEGMQLSLSSPSKYLFFLPQHASPLIDGERRETTSEALGSSSFSFYSFFSGFPPEALGSRAVAWSLWDVARTRHWCLSWHTLDRVSHEEMCISFTDLYSQASTQYGTASHIL